MFNFIPVSFSFLFLRLGLGLWSVIGLGFGFGFGIANLKHIDRWRCRRSGRSRPLAVCLATCLGIDRTGNQTISRSYSSVSNEYVSWAETDSLPAAWLAEYSWYGLWSATVGHAPLYYKGA